MNTNHLLLCAWAGPIFIILMLAGYLMTGALPPADPLASAEQIANMYLANLTGIRTGLVLMIFGAAFYAPFMAGIVVMMSRMGNPSGSMITTFALVCGGISVGLFVILVGWGVAAYRPDEFPQITRAFHDFTFVFLLWPGTLVPVTYLSLGLCILSDTRRPRVFPRWFAFYNFWSAVMALTGCLIIFFKHGPFAVDGLFAFWINLGFFFLWYIVVAVLLLQSVRRELQLPSTQGTRATEVAA